MDKRIYRLLIILGSAALLLPLGAWFVDKKKQPPEPGPQVTFTFLGDLMAHDVNFNRPPFDRIYRDIEPWIKNDDLTFANMEYPIAPNKPLSSWPRFNVPADYTKAALAAGVDVLSLANNHTTDQNSLGVKSTIKAMEALKKEHKTSYSGTRAFKGEFPVPETIILKDKKIGFISFTALLNVADPDNLVNDIPPRRRTAREKAIYESLLNYVSVMNDSFDLIVLAYHGGVEYSHTPNETKRTFMKELVAAGADIVWGHHPHVLQPWETIDTPEGKKLIIYSNGNLISGQTWSLKPDSPDLSRAATGEGALFSVDLSWPLEGSPSVAAVTPIPLVNYRSPEKGSTMEIRTIEGIMKDPKVSEAWKAYYRGRLPGILKHTQPIIPAPVELTEESNENTAKSL